MKRNYSQGSLEKHNGYWRGVLSWQDENGKQRRITKSTGVKCHPDKIDRKSGRRVPDNRGKATAEMALREWRDGLIEAEAQRVRVEEASCHSTFAEYADLYIRHKEMSETVKAVTIKGYRTYLRKILGTEIGDAKISELSPKMITAWEQALAADQISATTLSHIHVFAKQVCTYARRMGDIPANPFDLVDAPRRKTKPVNSLDTAGVSQLNEALRGFGSSPLAVGVRIALSTGMRQAEICALRWRDVNLDEKTIRVRQSLSREAGRYVLSEPKTASSLRSVPFGENLAAVLYARQESMRSDREEFGLGWDDALYVIGSAIKGTWYSPQVLGHEWRAFARAAGLVGTQGVPPRFHDLRHTFATLAISSASGNLDVKTVSAILGHSNAAMTLNVYADALEGAKRAGMDVMDGFMSA